MITIVNALAGSRLYGTNHETSDYDTMGIGVATKEQKLGLNYIEQIGQDDHVIYELSKWTRLALNGNPTILQMLWVKPEQTFIQDTFWEWKSWQRKLRSAVLSQRCIAAFLGYQEGQRKKILSDRQQRPELVAKYGFDVKFAAHMVRLGLQGVEVSTTGEMSLPCKESPLLKEILQGRYTKQETLDMASELEHTLKTESSVLPQEPDFKKTNKLLVEIYEECWD